jgi:hypothetical protein
MASEGGGTGGLAGPGFTTGGWGLLRSWIFHFLTWSQASDVLSMALSFWQQKVPAKTIIQTAAFMIIVISLSIIIYGFMITTTLS